MGLSPQNYNLFPSSVLISPYQNTASQYLGPLDTKLLKLH